MSLTQCIFFQSIKSIKINFDSNPIGLLTLSTNYPHFDKRVCTLIVIKGNKASKIQTDMHIYSYNMRGFTIYAGCFHF